MVPASGLPLLQHAIDDSSVFTPEALMDSVRRMRGLPETPVPAICVLEFDGDLTDWMVAQGIATRFAPWACFHTAMYTVDCGGVPVGIIARTIGGSYSVLVAEQLHAAGAQLIVGLTSAGRIAPDLPLPCLVIATGAIRDEGTSFHCLPPAAEVACPTRIESHLEHELPATGWAVRAGRVWTTDAPYRETSEEIRRWGAEGVLAVEMQAASLFAFATARRVNVAVVAMVSNAIDHEGDQFNTGTESEGLEILEGIARAGAAFLV